LKREVGAVRVFDPKGGGTADLVEMKKDRDALKVARAGPISVV
jgi:hypothetical protein